MENVGSIEYDARINTRDIAADAAIVERTVQRAADNGDRSFKTFASKASQSFNGIAASIATVAKVGAAVFIGGALGAGVFVKQASELQSMRASFESMTGSAEKTNQVMQSLYKFSFKTAFSQADINKSAQLLLGAGENVKLLGKDLGAIGDIAGATGANLGQLTLPLSQALARGKLQTQDFYQILNSGAGKLGQVLTEEVAKRGLGNLQDALANGTVTSEILFDTIQKAAAKGGFAFRGAIKQAETFNGRMSNLQETIGNVALNILGVDKATGKVDPNGVFAQLSKTVQDATNWLNQNKDTIASVARVLISNAVPAIAALTTAFVAAKVAAIGFSIAADANPIGLIAAAIVALIAGLTFLQVKFDIFGTAWSWLASVMQPVVTIFNADLLPVLRVLSNLIGSVFNVFLQQSISIINQLRVALQPIMPLLKVIGIAVLGSIVATLVVAIGTIGVAIGILAGLAAGIAYVINKSYQFASAAGRAFGSAAWAIRSAFVSLPSFFAGLWNRIIGLFGSVGSRVGNAIGGRFRAVINGVIGGAASMINGFVGAINGAIDIVNKIPKVNIGHLGYLPVPQLAKGGLVMPQPGGVLANIAEAGKPEAVIPLDRLDQMMSGKGGPRIENNIQNINIAKEVDADRVIRRLTGNQEAISSGLVPRQSYGGAA